MNQSLPQQPLAADAEPSAALQARPKLVRILAVLHVIGGAIVLAMTVGWGARLGALGPSPGSSPLWIQLSLVFLGGLGLASGVGMWRGTRWGWWLASFYYVYAIYRNGNAIIVISGMADQLAGETRGPGYYYVKHGGRIVTHSLVLVYLFRDRVLDYFGLRQLAKGPALARLMKPIAVLLVIQLLSVFW